MKNGYKPIFHCNLLLPTRSSFHLPSLLHLVLLLLILLNVILSCILLHNTSNSRLLYYSKDGLGAEEEEETRLILITPTYKRTERLADLTRMAQTLMHFKTSIHWIVIEDGPFHVPVVERLLQRSKLKYTYLKKQAAPGYPSQKTLFKGMYQRNEALEFIHKAYSNYKGNAVIYFADDDNSYDLRLFNDYLPKVQTIGFWAVGLAGDAYIEAPRVINSTFVGWITRYPKNRMFAIDMAGFGVNLKLILRDNAIFNHSCMGKHPEDCFLRQFDIPPSKCQFFGVDSNPKDVLVWHTRTKVQNYLGIDDGYVLEKVTILPPIQKKILPPLNKMNGNVLPLTRKNTIVPPSGIQKNAVVPTVT